ncbi:unnamed protein product, partial [Discosporangium mesarthrocarpum]
QYPHKTTHQEYQSNWIMTSEDEAAVLATTDIWIETVTSNTPNAPNETAALYSPDAILWGTVSEQVRHTPQGILDYFEFFATLPGLSVAQYDPEAVRIYGDFAINAGSYTFTWEDENGEKIEKRARYTFAYRRDPTTPKGWAMVEHHSSLMPVSPPTLKPVTSS